jgi:hypothetical protein
MSLDLTLYPMKYGELDWWLGHDRIKLGCNYPLFNEIKRTVTAQPLPNNVRFEVYDDDGITVRLTDAYGKPLTYATAGQFKAIKAEQLSEWNRAVITMIQLLPPETPVVLYWN